MDKNTTTAIKKGTLLLNLGSPDSPSIADVRTYLAQFLMDKYVIDSPWIIRFLVVYLAILPKRPKESAEAYHSIWTENGSPLVYISQKTQEKVQAKSPSPIYLAMRYGQPSIESVTKAIIQEGITNLKIIPLYPHYAMSSTQTALEEVKKNLKKTTIKTEIIHSFYKDPDYINALVSISEPYLKNIEHLLFSYHGLPYRHLVKTDPTHKHCQKVKNCCETPSNAHNTCYLHQTRETTKAFIEKSGINAQNTTIAYQSRLGNDPWITPNTEDVLVQLAQKGIKTLHVICPSFVADCLETLEEIKVRGKEVFQKAGGEELIYIPCLNDDEKWIQVLNKWT